MNGIKLDRQPGQKAKAALRESVIVAGFGGQGVMLAGKLLIHAGLIDGFHVTYIPSYGAEVRGGTAHCHVILSRDKIASPIIENPDFCLIMNGPSLAKFIPRVRTDGTMIINTSLAGEQPERKDIGIIRVPAGEIAEGLGNIKATNMVMLGSFAAASDLIEPEVLRETVTRFLPPRHRDLLDLNLKALTHGYECAATK